MMRKLLTLLLMLAFVGSVSAQKVARERQQSVHRMLKSGQRHALARTGLNQHRAPKKAIAVGDGQMWFGYCDDNDLSELGIALNADYHLATYIPYEKIAGKGATVDAISFMLQATKLKNLKVWVTTQLPEIGQYATGADLEVRPVTLQEYTPGQFTEVAFSKSYEIPEGGLWIGLSFEISGMPEAPDDSEISDEDYYGWWYDDVYKPWLEKNLADASPFFCSFSDTYQQGSMVFASDYYDEVYRSFAQMTGDDSYLDWQGWDDYSYDGYCVAIKALIGGNKFLGNAASAEGLGQKYTLLNENVTFPLTLTNSGKNGIHSFTYEVAINGAKTEEHTVTLDEPVEGIMKTYSTQVSFNSGNTAGSQKIVLTVTKVNGEANELNAVVEGSIFALTETAQRKPLVEEFTGTWCGWCTRGMVGLEKLSEDFEGQIIPIAIHNGDPMEIDAYTGVISSYVSGYPSMLIDRTADVDPYYGSSDDAYGVKDDVEAALSNIAAASVKVKAAWKDEAQTKIDIQTETRVMYDEAEPSMALGYVVVADGLKGSGRDWAQSNYYSGDAATADYDPNLMTLVGMDEYIIGMEFNHVAVAAWGVDNGVENSITGAVTAGKPIASSFEADLNSILVGIDRNSEYEVDHVSAAQLVAGKKVYVVAILFNKVTGEVVNADEVELAGYGEDAINVVDALQVQPTANYNLAGQQMAKQQRGINIVRLSNGKAVKVVVK